MPIQSDPCGRILSVRTAKVSVPSMMAGGLESWIYMPCDASPHAWPGGRREGWEGRGVEDELKKYHGHPETMDEHKFFGHLKTRLLNHRKPLINVGFRGPMVLR